MQQEQCLHSQPCALPAATISALLFAYWGNTRPGQSHRHRVEVTFRVCTGRRKEDGCQYRMHGPGRATQRHQARCAGRRSAAGGAAPATAQAHSLQLPAQRRPGTPACQPAGPPTWKCLVLPGVGATAVFLEPNRALMVEDLPTLG